MDAKIREQVKSRAANRCEYCRLQQRHDGFHSFHIEHIIARQHGGLDEYSNLALACHQCNLHKGPNLSGLDPDTGELTRLFHPRNDHWNEHFIADEIRIVGKTALGRTTAWLLQMNSEERLALRKILKELNDLD